jgi:putative methyltransferase (TIGR04325 family)
MQVMRTLLRSALPPPVRRWLRLALRPRWFRGEFRTWSEARAASQGYDDQAVLARVVAATRQASADNGVWDRDGMVFRTAEVNVPLLAALRKIAAEENGHLGVVDFGGAFGSTWRQHRSALSDLPSVFWRVVEQPHYVTAGREFANEVLDFFPTLEAALAGGAATTVLLSSVLPYIEHPLALLEEIARSGLRHVIIDRTSFAVDGRERIVVQCVPKELGGGSYPCWLFSRDSLLRPLAGRYRLVAEWPGFDDIDPKTVYRGFHFERIA